jgi:hypothetical protein
VADPTFLPIATPPPFIEDPTITEASPTSRLAQGGTSHAPTAVACRSSSHRRHNAPSFKRIGYIRIGEDEELKRLPFSHYDDAEHTGHGGARSAPMRHHRRAIPVAPRTNPPRRSHTRILWSMTSNTDPIPETRPCHELGIKRGGHSVDLAKPSPLSSWPDGGRSLSRPQSPTMPRRPGRAHAVVAGMATVV